ncbi:hypothetical protein AAG570_003269 [Ranatra chinensis]|uniref:Transcriptional adapter n=1 Tax=Ranatra chinensis TaxID=642074 RepID=A0ABD0Y8E5_9HEMI
MSSIIEWVIRGWPPVSIHRVRPPVDTYPLLLSPFNILRYVADLFSKFCTYCQDDIPGIRVKCVDCQDFDLCLQCFSAGAEIGPHKNDHSYQFVDSGSLELFRSKSGWSAREELQLLNCVERYGFGNWEAIAQHIKTRTADEVRDEYMNRYLDGSLGRATWPEAMKCRARLANLLGKEEPSVPAQSPAHLPPLDVTPEEASQLGYMPHRDDFEREYDNEAESLVTSLNISGEDDELDIALKLAQVDMYIQRLRERTRRKRVCQDYQLVSQYFASRRERPSRKKSTAEQELEEKLFGLCQFQTVQEHDGLLKSIVRQKELQRRLQELLRYRKNGLTMLEEMSHFEQERQSRESVDGSVRDNSSTLP